MGSAGGSSRRGSRRVGGSSAVMHNLLNKTFSWLRSLPGTRSFDSVLQL